MRKAILTAIAISFSAALCQAQEAPLSACGGFEDYRIWLVGTEDLFDEAATAACGVPKEAAELVDGCTTVIETSTDDGVLADAHFNRALGRVVLGDLAGAIEDLDRLLPSDSDSDAYDMRGLAYFCQGDLDRALADFNAALEAWDENELALSDRARIHFARGNFSEAYEDAYSAYEIESENATALVLMGAIEEHDGAMVDAAFSYDEALEVDFFCDCGEIDYVAVEAAFDRVFAAASGPALAGCREGDSVVESCSDYLELGYLLSDSDVAEAYTLRGNAHLAADDLDDALADFDNAIENAAEVADGYLGRGRVRALTDDLEGALADFAEASRLDPDNPHPLAERARAYVFQGELKLAWADIAGALHLDPNFPTALALRGVVRERQGQSAEALADFNAALAIDPDLPMALQGAARLSR